MLLPTVQTSAPQMFGYATDQRFVSIWDGFKYTPQFLALTDLPQTGAAIGNVLTWDGAEWGPAAPSGGGGTPPGGASGDVQYNDGAGGFAGDAGCAIDTGGGNVLLKLSAPSGGPAAGWQLYDSVGNLQGQYTVSDSGIAFAAHAGGSYSLGFDFDSGAGTTRVLCGGGVLEVGDPNGDWYGTRLVVSDTNGTNSIEMGDLYTFTTGAKFKLDIPAGRAEWHNLKHVIAETGSLYMYDSGTSTYWKWESVNGVWTGTDTTSASLP